MPERSRADGRAERLRVLVLDAAERQSLAACRALGRAGHEVGVAGYEASAIAGYSRHVARYHRLPSPRGREQPFIEALEAVIGRHGYEVVVATLDPTLVRLSEVELSVPTFPVLGEPFRQLTDKVGLAGICERLGVPYPRTFAPPDKAGDEEALAAVGLPAVVKAARSAVVGDETVAAHGGATITRDPEQALRVATALRQKGVPPLFQEHVAGAEKVNAMLLRRPEGLEFRYAHLALREIPPSGGRGVALRTLDRDTGLGAEAIALLERVCTAAGFYGLAMAELYRAKSDGRLWLIEINPRLWGSTWFAERLGQRVTERGVRFALGLPALPETPYPSGRRFHSWPGELRWVLRHERRFGPLVEVLRETRPWDLFEYQDASDPWPLLRYAFDKARRRVAIGRKRGGRTRAAC